MRPEIDRSECAQSAVKVYSLVFSLVFPQRLTAVTVSVVAVTHVILRLVGASTSSESVARNAAWQ